MYETITLKDMISAMDKGYTFSIGFVTCNEQKKTGGEWVFLTNMVKHGNTITEQKKALKQAIAQPNQPQSKMLKNPNHYQNSTRNIRSLDTGAIVKIHIRLVRMFNGKKVL